MLNALHFKPMKAREIKAKDIILIPMNNHKDGIGYVAYEVDGFEVDGISNEVELTLRDKSLRIGSRFHFDATVLIHRW